MRTIHSLIKILTTLCLLLALITACGQRGPLYLPEKNPAAAPAQEQQPAATKLPQRTEVENDAGR